MWAGNQANMWVPRASEHATHKIWCEQMLIIAVAFHIIVHVYAYACDIGTSKHNEMIAHAHDQVDGYVISHTITPDRYIPAHTFPIHASTWICFPSLASAVGGTIGAP